MSGKLCIWCQFRPTEWSTCNHTPGAGWAIKSMQDSRDKIVNGEVKRQEDKEGIVEKLLVDAMPVEYFFNYYMPKLVWVINYYCEMTVQKCTMIIVHVKLYTYIAASTPIMIRIIFFHIKQLLIDINDMLKLFIFNHYHVDK